MSVSMTAQLASRPPPVVRFQWPGSFAADAQSPHRRSLPTSPSHSGLVGLAPHSLASGFQSPHRRMLTGSPTQSNLAGLPPMGCSSFVADGQSPQHCALPLSRNQSGLVGLPPSGPMADAQSPQRPTLPTSPSQPGLLRHGGDSGFVWPDSVVEESQSPQQRTLTRCNSPFGGLHGRSHAASPHALLSPNSNARLSVVMPRQAKSACLPMMIPPRSQPAQHASAEGKPPPTAGSASAKPGGDALDSGSDAPDSGDSHTASGGAATESQPPRCRSPFASASQPGLLRHTMGSGAFGPQSPSAHQRLQAARAAEARHSSSVSLPMIVPSRSQPGKQPPSAGGSVNHRPGDARLDADSSRRNPTLLTSYAKGKPPCTGGSLSLKPGGSMLDAGSDAPASSGRMPTLLTSGSQAVQQAPAEGKPPPPPTLLASASQTSTILSVKPEPEPESGSDALDSSMGKPPSTGGGSLSLKPSSAVSDSGTDASDSRRSYAASRSPTQSSSGSLSLKPSSATRHSSRSLSAQRSSAAGAPFRYGKPSGDAMGSCSVSRLLAAMGKGAAGDDAFITVRDLVTNVDAVKEHAPRLLQDFCSMDQAGSGRVSAKQLKEHLCPTLQQGAVPQLSRQELQEIWDRLVSGRTDDTPADSISLQDLHRHLKFVERNLPELVERFHEMDTERIFSIKRTEFDAFFGDGEAWLETRLADMIGLHDLKEQIRAFYWATRLDQMRRRGGAVVSGEEAHVLLFKGNPGVGKTTVARLIAGLLRRIGIIPTEELVEVQRDQLVGDHIGATERTTTEAIDKARGGVLFVDEAYRLSSDAFGVEAINCLMRAMSEKGSVIVLAGYPKEMDQFVSVNPGIKRRITYEFTFPDYDSSDLAKIFEQQVRRRGFKLCAEATTDRIASAMRRHVTEAQRAAMNGGVVEHACRHAIFHLNRQQIEMVRAAQSNDGQPVAPSITLRLCDVDFGCRQVPAVSLPRAQAPADDQQQSAAPSDDCRPGGLARSDTVETLAVVAGSDAFARAALSSASTADTSSANGGMSRTSTADTFVAVARGGAASFDAEGAYVAVAGDINAQGAVGLAAAGRRACGVHASGFQTPFPFGTGI